VSFNLKKNISKFGMLSNLNIAILKFLKSIFDMLMIIISFIRKSTKKINSWLRTISTN